MSFFYFVTHLFFEQQTISSDLFTGRFKGDLWIQKKRESWLFSRIMRSSECTCITRYKSCPRYRTGIG